jgi:hypothetical protein
MKRGGRDLVLLACGMVLGVGATASAVDASQNPYQAVVERNVFGLKPPPPPPDPESIKPPLPKITLTGIITVGGTKRALMKTPPPVGAPVKPGEPPKTEQGYILALGEREGEIEVLEIDEKAGRVKVNYGGSVTDLTFEKDGVKTPPTPGPGAVPQPGAPPGMRPGIPVPGAMPGIGTGMPARPLRLPGAGAVVTPQASTGAGVSATSLATGGRGVPVMNVGVNSSISAQAPAQQGSSSMEVNLMMLEVNRIKNQPLVEAGLMPPLPQHPLSEDMRSALLGADSSAARTTTPIPSTTLPLAPTIPQPIPQQAPQ